MATDPLFQYHKSTTPPAAPQPDKLGATQSPKLSPSDQVRMLVELLQPLGPELVRRWVATLLMVPREEREGVVTAVEQRVSAMYEQSWRSGETAAQSMNSREFDVIHPPNQRDGYVEQIVTTYGTNERSSTNATNAHDKTPPLLQDEQRRKVRSTKTPRKLG
jgi:hypothetical protein